MPIYGIPLKQYVNFTNNNVRDILAVSSEETDNRCTGSPQRFSVDELKRGELAVTVRYVRRVGLGRDRGGGEVSCR
jgi:hypothetical protein